MQIFIEDVIAGDGEVKSKLYIESDTFGYMVRQFNGMRTDRHGKEFEQWDTLGYFSTIQGCCKYLLNRKLKESTAVTLAELRTDVERIEGYIRSHVLKKKLNGI